MLWITIRAEKTGLTYTRKYKRPSLTRRLTYLLNSHFRVAWYIWNALLRNWATTRMNNVMLEINWEIVSVVDHVRAMVVTLQTDISSISGTTDTMAEYHKGGWICWLRLVLTLHIVWFGVNATVDNKYDDLRGIHHEERTQNDSRPIEQRVHMEDHRHCNRVIRSQQGIDNNSAYCQHQPKKLRQPNFLNWQVYNLQSIQTWFEFLSGNLEMLTTMRLDQLIDSWLLVRLLTSSMIQGCSVPLSIIREAEQEFRTSIGPGMKELPTLCVSSINHYNSKTGDLQSVWMLVNKLRVNPWCTPAWVH